MKKKANKLDLGFDMDGYLVRILNESEISKLQKLFEESNDYFQIILNRDTLPSDAEFHFRHVPRGNTMEDKFIYGVFKTHELVGVMDLIRNYPDMDTWFLGLLILTPKERGSGLGKMTFEKVAEILRNNGVKKIRISVANQNTKAFNFWTKLGFTENGTGHEGISEITYFDYLLD